MSEANLFTQQESEEMCAATSGLIHAAIDAGDTAKAHALLDRLVEETRALHDAYLLWLTGMQSFIYREMGFESFERSQIETFAHTSKAWAKHALPADASLKERILARAFGLRSHGTALAVEEDGEKISFTMKGGCASGSRLLKMGFYEQGQGGELIKEERPLTFNRKRFPVQCTHCSLQQMGKVAAGEPLAMATIPDQDLTTGLCRFNIYKPGHAAPEGHLETLRETGDVETTDVSSRRRQ